ncbi:MAG: N-acetyl-gamma-glutamyl-phosphate reductase [Candidatus Saganbacteria bacterium]|uniref:N-acetyl-gamma-glutamyl-phosphate reductase n=1 Tax=Candidatus Saganbacteria bacterium TaxID=2575572 RepID=A0A833NYT4_UNCSA|nr:MAG: N-acetyl-gamma-glutamyl-phosphate reductase [Candidatus Saganbacteria bacterium]
MIKAGIIGAGGYAGVNLLSLLIRHPEAKVVWLVSEEAHKGKKISELYPHLKGINDLSCQTLNELDGLIKDIDVVFLALPHGIAINYVPKILKAGKKVIDLGADYRFSKEAVFGLPEIYKEKIKGARLIANPGCYPTASILGMAPLVKNGLIDVSSINLDAKSGVSGAGRGVSLKVQFCERNEGVTAYAVNNHRHMGEIEYQLGRILGSQMNVTFVPHLMPMNRGILVTGYSKLRDTHNALRITDLIKLYKDFYKDAAFVRIYETGEPCTKNVSGTNFCDIGLSINEATGTVIVMSAIDNLIKGAAGQAVQNMNLVFGNPEKMGLEGISIFP